jgi:hypothetical protein
MNPNKPTTHPLEITESTLKSIALITMLIDHIAAVLIPSRTLPYIIMRFIGRFSAPIFCWFLVQGFWRTRNFKKYLSRVFLFAVLSYYPYILALKGGNLTFNDISENYLQLNMLFTFFFGLIFLYGVHKAEKIPLKVAFVLLGVVGISFCSYGLFGLGMIVAMDVMYSNKKLGVLAFTAVIFAKSYDSFTTIFSGNDTFLELKNSLPTMYSLIIKIIHDNFAFLLPMCLVALPQKPNQPRPTTGEKWFFYIFYPAHLFLLGLLICVAN